MGNSLGETVQVLRSRNDTDLVDTDLVDRPNSAQTIDIDGGRAVDIDNLALAAEGGEASLAVVLEEAVEAGTINQNGLGICDLQTPCGLLIGEDRVVVGCHRAEWGRGSWVGLIVWLS